MIKLSIRYATKLTCDYCFIVQHIKNFCSNLFSFHSSLSSYIFAWLFFLLKSFLFLRFSFFYFLFCNFVIFLYSGRIYFYVAISRSYSKFENPLQKIFFEHFSSNINSIVPLRQRKAVVWRCSQKFCKILGKTSVLQLLQTCNFIKKTLQCNCLSILPHFLYRTLSVAIYVKRILHCKCTFTLRLKSLVVS